MFLRQFDKCSSFFSSTDLAVYSSPALFSDPGELDFGFDSGIEAEMDEPKGKIIIIPLAGLYWEKG